MTIIKSGTKALLINGSVEGTVTACEISYENVTYKFSYFRDGEIKTAWVNEKELDIQGNKKQTIGFK